MGVHKLDPNHHACQHHEGEISEPKEGDQASEENKTEEDLKKENKELKEMMRRQNIDDLDTKDLQKVGINTALAIALHNFPEGLATFVATLADASVGPLVRALRASWCLHWLAHNQGHG